MLLPHQHPIVLILLLSLMHRGTALEVMMQTMTMTNRMHTSSSLHLFLCNMINNLISFPLILYLNILTITTSHLHQICCSIPSTVLSLQWHTRSTVVSIHAYLRSLASTWPCLFFILFGHYITLLYLDTMESFHFFLRHYAAPFFPDTMKSSRHYAASHCYTCILPFLRSYTLSFFPHIHRLLGCF